MLLRAMLPIAIMAVSLHAQFFRDLAPSVGSSPPGVFRGTACRLNAGPFPDYFTYDFATQSFRFVLDPGMIDPGNWPASMSIPIPPGANYGFSDIADMNGDQLDDIVFVRRISSGFNADNFETNIYYNQGNATFAAPVVVIPTSFPAINLQPLIADFDGNGLKDIGITINLGAFGPYGLRIHLNLPQGFVPQPLVAVSSSIGRRCADVDGDGTAEIVRSVNPSTFDVWKWDGTTMVNIQTLTINTVATSIPAGFWDFDRDGKLDYAMTSGGSAGSMTIYFGSTIGLDPMPLSLSTTSGGSFQGFAMTSGDIDVDGIVDVVLVRLGNPGTPHDIAVFRGLATRSYSPIPHIVRAFPGGENPVLGGASDIDQDGDADIIVRIVGPAPVFSAVETVLLNDAVYGRGCGAVIEPRLTVRTAHIDNPNFALDVTRAASNSPAILAVSGARMPIAPCSILIDVDQLLLPSGFVMALTDGIGNASIGFPIPNIADLRGFEFSAQAAILDPAGPLAYGGLSFGITSARVVTIF